MPVQTTPMLKPSLAVKAFTAARTKLQITGDGTRFPRDKWLDFSIISVTTVATTLETGRVQTDLIGSLKINYIGNRSLPRSFTGVLIVSVSDGGKSLAVEAVKID